MGNNNDIGRKSFILHIDSLSILDELTNEQKGMLFEAIYRYQKGESYELDFALKLAFLPFKNQFERDFEKYENKCNINKMNGLKGGRPTKPNKTQKTQSVFSEPKKPDNDNDNDNDNDSKNDNKKKNKSVYIPTLEEFGKFAIEHKPDLDKYTVKLKYDAWVENGWKDGNDKPIKNWKTKLLNTIPHLKTVEIDRSKVGGRKTSNYVG